MTDDFDRRPPVSPDLWRTVPDDMRPEVADRIRYLRSYGIEIRVAFDAAFATMAVDRDAAEARTRSIRTWLLSYRIKTVVEAVRQSDGRDDPRVTALVAAVHDEAVARVAGLEKTMAPAELDGITEWYAGILRVEAEEERRDGRYPNSIRKELWDEVPADYRQEALDRAGFLILRGLQPEAALIEAMGQIVEEMNGMSERGYEPLHASHMRDVAHFFSLPWRSPDGRYMRRVIRLSEQIHENAMARMLGETEHVEEDPDLTHLGSKAPAKIERLTRLYCDRIRHALAREAIAEAEAETAG